MASREELLSSIRPDMKLNRAFFLRIYGYEITWPGFADTALESLKAAGCSKATEYYQKVVGEYEEAHQREVKEAVRQFMKSQEKRGEGPRDRIEKSLRQMSNSELITHLENLIGVSS